MSLATECLLLPATRAHGCKPAPGHEPHICRTPITKCHVFPSFILNPGMPLSAAQSPRTPPPPQPPSQLGSLGTPLQTQRCFGEATPRTPSHFISCTAQVREFNILFAQIRLGCCFIAAAWSQISGPELKHKALGNLSGLKAQGRGAAKACAGEWEGASTAQASVLEVAERRDQAGGNLLDAQHGPEQSSPASHALCNVLFGVSSGVSSMPMASTRCIPQDFASRMCPSLTKGTPMKSNSRGHMEESIWAGSQHLLWPSDLQTSVSLPTSTLTSTISRVLYLSILSLV